MRHPVRSRPVVGVALLTAWLGLAPGIALAEHPTPTAAATVAGQQAPLAQPHFRPGAAGIGDPYFPLDGNGGYDAQHYLLDIDYRPATDKLKGVATITARATQDLSRFNLDFDGLTVRAISVNGRRASWTRRGGELTVTPAAGLRKGRGFITVVRYDGIPKAGSGEFGSGFTATEDGALVAGEPDSAASWYPVNDHPLDKASYTFRVTAPAGLEVVANGILKNKATRGGSTTWLWDAREPMASYLTTVDIGHFQTRSYRLDGISYFDAIDPALFARLEPRTGRGYAISQASDLSYKRLARTIAVPAAGGKISFWVNRDTEPTWDFAFVEAHTVGADDWTTLPDLNGHTSPDTGSSCPIWLSMHPFLTHYQTQTGDEGCSASGSTGTWSAASGASDGWEQWTVDLAPFAGKQAEISISYASDDSVQGQGLFVDDIRVPFGPGSTSFDPDANPSDGWTVPGAPLGSATNDNDWIVGTVADAPPSTGDKVTATFAQEPEILAFLSRVFGPYPFKAAGGIVDKAELGFALETQTRPIYDPVFFVGSGGPLDSVVVHENAHQWTGDSLALARWQDIWLNEGFATYAEWLWSEHQGRGTAQQIFEDFSTIPADSPFWQLPIGDPGPEDLFAGQVYDRGAATLHALRLEVGNRAFFQILRRWTSSHAGGNVTTREFIALSEQISGQDLGAFFETWLFTPSKPAGLEAASPSTAAARSRALDARHIHAKYALANLGRH